MTKQASVEVVMSAADEKSADIVIDESGNTIAEPVIDENETDAAELPARAIKNANGTVTLPLRVPVSVRVRDHAGKERTDTYRELTFSYLTGGDIRAIQTATKDMASVVSFARATKTSQAVMNAIFDKLHAADIRDGDQIMSFFVQGGL